MSRMDKQKQKDPWTFSIVSEKGRETFNSDPELRIKLLSAIKEYDYQVEYVKDPENNMSQSNLGFERNVLLDHIEIIVKSHLESLKK